MYTLQEGVLTCTLPNGALITQDKHPETNEPVTEANARDVLQACIPADQWDALRKLEGVELEGVMCSATKDDQSGLVAVLTSFQLQGESFAATRFDFTNGNHLVITRENIQSFIAVWMPFRQSFFAPE